jgi:hypothetical protein
MTLLIRLKSRVSVGVQQVLKGAQRYGCRHIGVLLVHFPPAQACQAHLDQQRQEPH